LTFTRNIEITCLINRPARDNCLSSGINARISTRSHTLGRRASSSFNIYIYLLILSCYVRTSLLINWIIIIVTRHAYVTYNTLAIRITTDTHARAWVCMRARVREPPLDARERTSCSYTRAHVGHVL